MTQYVPCCSEKNLRSEKISAAKINHLPHFDIIYISSSWVVLYDSKMILQKTRNSHRILFLMPKFFDQSQIK